MPELPEAESIARTLDARLRNRIFARTVAQRADILHGARSSDGELPLSGRRVIGVSREGKRVVVALDNDATLVFALGMTGRVTVEPVAQSPTSHTHLRVAIRGTDDELRFRDPRRFGGVWYVNGAPADDGRSLAPLGVEPLTVELRQFRTMLNRGRQIKALLMDQRVIAGLGNIYCDESLHRAGIHPLMSANTLAPAACARLLRCIRSVLTQAIRHNGTTLMDYRDADGSPGSFQRKHRVYGRQGRPCRTCGTPIIRITAAGRSTHLCTTCQPPADH